MPAKKQASKKSSKAKASKRAKRVLPIVPLYLPDKPSNRSTRDWTQAPRLPNPWPSDIVKLVGMVSSQAGLAYVFYKVIKLWFDERKARKMIIQKGSVKVEIQGAWSTKRIIAAKLYGYGENSQRGFYCD